MGGVKIDPLNIAKNQNSEPCPNISSSFKMFQCDGNVTAESSSFVSDDEKCSIPTIVTSNRSEVPSYQFNQVQHKKGNLKTLKRNNKISEASNLPIVLNLNPRSLYQKLDEFQTLIEQTDPGVCCISESWDRSHVPGGALLSDLIDIEGYQLVQNIVQRKKKGVNQQFLPIRICIMLKSYHLT